MKYIVLAIKAIDKTSEIVGKAASCFIILIVLLQLKEVVMRYVFSQTTAWGWEVVTYMYGINFILAIPWALKEGRHIRTDVLFARLSKKQQTVLDLCTFSTFFLLFCGFLAFFTIKLAVWSTSILETSVFTHTVPVWPLHIALALGFVLLLLQGLAKITRDVIFLVKGEAV